VSLAAGSGYGSSVTLTQTSGTVNNTTIYVRSSATAATGNISGKVVLTSTTATQFVAVAGTVNALATVNTVPNQTVNNGKATAAVNFSGTGNTFTWVNDTPGIGLAASGTGNIGSFTAVNTGSGPVTATITATPLSSGFAYIANFGLGTVSVINTSTGKVVSNVTVGSDPICVSVSPDGTKAYVANEYAGVSVINTATNTVTATINADPIGISVSPDGALLYVVNVQLNNVYVFNTATNALVSTIAVGNYPQYIAISPVGNRAYVTNALSNNVSVINTLTNLVVATIPVGFLPQQLAVSPDGSRVYVSNVDSGNISVINTATNAVVATITPNGGAQGLVVSNDGSRLYVTDNNEVSVVNTATNTVASTIAVGNYPLGVSLSPDGSQLYVVNSNDNSVSVINTASNTVAAVIYVSQSGGLGPKSFGNFVTKGACTGPSTKFTITVNPSPAIAPNITSTAAIGTISACSGTASVSPNVQQVMVSGVALTAAISLTAPNNFEISLSATSGFGNALTINPVGGTVNSVPVYVRSAATAAPPSISGNITGTSPGARTIEIPVTGMVNALPSVNTVPNQTITNGTATTAVNFTGTGNTFTWTNDTPGIGLSASGTGNIATFTAKNTGTSPVVATVTTTPANTQLAFIANFGSNSVSVINTTTQKVVSVIAVGNGPGAVTVSPNGGRAYVANANDGTVSVINTATDLVIATITVGSFPGGLKVSPDGSRLYVVNAQDNNVSVINTINDKLLSTIAVGTNPVGLSVSPDGSEVYVANGVSNTLSVINASTETVTATIPMALDPTDVEVSPDGSEIYVTNRGSNNILVVNAKTYALMSTIAVGPGPTAMSESPDGSLIYVANENSNTVSIINTATESVESTITVGSGPAGLSISTSNNYLYAVNSNDGTVSVISTLTNLIVDTVFAGSNPISFGDFISGTGCTGPPIQFTITVNPSPAQTSGIIVGQATGSITACQGTASASPNIQQFIVSGTSLTSPIVLTAPNNFEISLSPGSGYTNTLTLPLSGTSVNTTNVYVRSAATAPAGGNISGNVSINSTGVQPQKVPVIATVNAPPTVNTILPHTFVNGAITGPVNFSGTGNVFNWTNDTPGIGLPASGTGSLPSFTAVNTGTTPITAKITVTPSSSGFAYVANYGSNTVSVINTASNSLVTNISVGKNPWGVAVSPDGTKVYVTNQTSNSVSVIDAATNSVSAVINVGMSPEGVAVSPDGGTLYVANETSGTVSVINTVTDAIVSLVGVGSNPQGIAVSPDGTMVYVANAISNTVSVISTSGNILVANVTVGQHPFAVAVSPDGSVYVTNLSDNTVSVISTLTNLVTATVPVGASPDGVCVSPDGSRVYVSASNAGNIAVINTATSVVSYYNVDPTPDGLSLSNGGNFLYVNNFGNGSVSILNTSTGTVVSTISVGQFPVSIGNFIWQGSGCPGVPTTFTITINPTPSASATIVANSATGSISACVGTASVSPQLEQFTVAGSKLTGDITATAPPGFEVSLSAASSFGNAVTITQSGGNINNKVIYVRSASTASPGPVSGNVVLSSPGALSQSVAVSGTVNYLPAVNLVNNQTFTNGILSTPINFSGTGNVFSWTNSSPGIGLGAGGTGNIPSFIPINNGTSPITATVSVSAASVPYAYVANSISNNVSVIDVGTNAVIATVPVGNYPCAVAVSPDGSQVYIANQRSNSISVISASTNSVAGTISSGSNSPIAIAVSPNGQSLYVLNLNANSVSVYSTSTYALTASIGVGGYPVGIAVTPDGSKLYVTNSSNSISVIDVAHGVVKTTIPAGQSPFGIVVSPDGSKVYVAIAGAGEVLVISTASDASIATIPVGVDPAGVTITPDGSTVYVANQFSNSVSVISTATNTVTGTIAVGTAPTGLSVTSDGSEVYAVNQKSNNVSVISTGSNTVISTVNVGSYPISLGNFINKGTGCIGAPITFTITVNPTPPTAVTAAGILNALTTTYGTPSPSETFSVSGTSLTSGILVTPPAGFELSTNDVNFSTTITIGGGGNVSAQTVYIRLAATTPVGNNYSGNIQLSSPGAAIFNLAMPTSSVTPAILAIIADDKNKTFGMPNPPLTASYVGFVNFETLTVLTTPAILATTATINSPVGLYPITVSGATAQNYTISPVPGTLTILPTEQALIIPNTFTPNGDGINDTWNIKFLNSFVNCSVDVFTRWGQKIFSSTGYPIPWDGTYKGAALPSGTYYYVINLKNGLGPLSGFVAIIR
jgi:gliding motility-associated-like protein